MTADEEEAWQRLALLWPWPIEPLPMPPQSRGWRNAAMDATLETVVPRDADGVVVELGAWEGLGTRKLLHRPRLKVASIDTWLGGRESHLHEQTRQNLEGMHERFLGALQMHKERLIPARVDSLTGLELVAECGVHPRLVVVDAGHSKWATYADLSATLDLFREAIVLGDDLPWASVAEAAQRVAAERDRTLFVDGGVFMFMPQDAPRPGWVLQRSGP